MANQGTGTKFAGGDDRFVYHEPSIEEFLADLEESKKGLARSVMASAMRKSFKPVVSLAKKRSPVDTGHLKKSIKVQTATAHSRRRYGVVKEEAAIQLGPFKKTDVVYSEKRKKHEKSYHRAYVKAVVFHSFLMLRTPFIPFIADAVEELGTKAMEQAASMTFEIWEARLNRQQKKIQE